MADLNDETICAIATPPGHGGIGIVRVSGPRALALCAAVVRLRSGCAFEQVATHRAQPAELVRPSDPSTILDQALVTVMRAPTSYTGEDVIELSCHGNPLILELLCETLIQAGARLAEPGEFTRRAFLNGRIDLAQAEAVLDTITAKTAGALRVAQEQLRGRLSKSLGVLRERLISLLAHLEAGIDFVEEDIAFVSQPELIAGVAEARAEIDALIDSFREGRVLREGLSIAIVGRPNVGKSSLLNALLRRDRAIVTDIPGTTRDMLEETLNIRGIPVRLVDTAGLRETDDPVERHGIARSRTAIVDADLVIVMLDGSAPMTPDDQKLLAETERRARLVAINKSDLPAAWERRDLHLKDLPPIIGVSAKTEDGLDALRDTIRRLAMRPEFEPGERPIVTHLRHRTNLTRAAEALNTAQAAIVDGLPAECIAMDLRAAIEAIGAITGAITTEDILERIFRDFCIGK